MTVENLLFCLDEFTYIEFWSNNQILISGFVCEICDRLQYREYRLQRVKVRDNVVTIIGYKYM